MMNDLHKRPGIYLLIVVLALIASNKGRAQFSEVGVGVGTSIYWGDLNAPEFMTNVENGRLAGQVFFRYNMTPKLSLRGGLLVAQLHGDDRNSSQDWQKERNLRFTNTLTELSMHCEYYLYNVDYNYGRLFSPYVSVGLSAFRHNPKTDYMGETIELQPLGTEGQGMPGFASKYALVSGAASFGGGVKLALTESLSVDLGLLFRRTFTDYLDDVSTNYVNYNELLAGNGELAAEVADRRDEALGLSEPLQVETGSQRGGSLVDDYFVTVMLSMSYHFNTGLSSGKRGRVDTSKCPTF